MAAGDLTEELALFRLAFEASPVPCALFSFETVRFLAVNDAYLAFIHWKREEFLAADAYELWMRLTHPDDLELERTEVQRMVEGDIDGYRLKKRYPQPDGSYRWGDFTVRS